MSCCLLDLYDVCSKGSKSGASMKCPVCQGSGMKISIRQLGPSMIQQMQHPCNECKGTGETINDKDRCTQCKGETVVLEKKVLEVNVEKGMQNGQRITFPGEADEAVRKNYFILFIFKTLIIFAFKIYLVFYFFSMLGRVVYVTNFLLGSVFLQPDTVTGDIVFILQQKEHPKYKRKGDDIFYEHTLSLTEALCGFQFILTHLDGRQLLIKSQPGEVVKPGK